MHCNCALPGPKRNQILKKMTIRFFLEKPLSSITYLGDARLLDLKQSEK